MKQQTNAKALSIYIGEQDQWQGGPLFTAIVTRLKSAGIAGVSVFHGVEGYGCHKSMHTSQIEVLFEGLPILIQAVDSPDSIAAVLPLLGEMVVEGLVTIQDVVAIRYSKD